VSWRLIKHFTITAATVGVAWTYSNGLTVACAAFAILFDLALIASHRHGEDR
jgi:hypothetical protein